MGFFKRKLHSPKNWIEWVECKIQITWDVHELDTNALYLISKYFLKGLQYEPSFHTSYHILVVRLIGVFMFLI